MSKIVDNILIGPPNSSPKFMEDINQTLDEYLNKIIEQNADKISTVSQTQFFEANLTFVTVNRER